MRKYKIRGSFDILTDISGNITLVQLMYCLVNVDPDNSVVGFWIYDSNYEKALVLNRESLDTICAPYVGEKQVAKFETVLCCEIHLLKSAPKEGILYIHQLNN